MPIVLNDELREVEMPPIRTVPGTNQTSHLCTSITDTYNESEIYLRIVEHRDAPAVSRLFSNPELQRWTGFKQTDEDEAYDQIRAMRLEAGVPTYYLRNGSQVQRRPEILHFVIVHRGQDQVIGVCFISMLNHRQIPGRHFHTGNIQVAIDPEYQRLGFGTSAIEMLLDLAFTKAQEGGLQLNSVQMVTTQDNEAFENLARDKLGLVAMRAAGQTQNPPNDGAGLGAAQVTWRVWRDRWQIDAERVIQN